MQWTYFYNPSDVGHEEVRRRIEGQREIDAEEDVTRQVRRYADDDE